MTCNINLKIYGLDVNNTAPALAYCDKAIITCPMRDANYIKSLINICSSENIDLVIPTIDTDLYILSQHKQDFKQINTRVLISEPDKIKLCRDKNLTAKFFADCGLNAPTTFNDYKKYNLTWPAFIKPKDGSSSINANKANNFNELELYAQRLHDGYIIQNFISGTEYTVDIFCDFDGNALSIVPRERIAVRSGEVLKTKIFMDAKIISEAELIIKHFKPCGPLTVQLIRDNLTGQDYFIEINPRFGGGAPLSIKAGARSPELLLKLLAHQEINNNFKIADSAIFSRFDQSVQVCSNSKQNNFNIKGVIFDLDDTLYPERDYIKSGFNKAAEFLGDLNYAARLFKLFEDGLPAIDILLGELDKINLKDKCLEIYREHEPDIKLYDGIEELLIMLRDLNIQTGIITDGRPEGQRNKIKALNLNKYFDANNIIITDELGGAQFRKPNDIAFRIMRTRWKLNYNEILYIGDNLDKDFQAPRQLGMRTLHFANPESIYYSTRQTCEGEIFCCDAQAASIAQIRNYLEAAGLFNSSALSTSKPFNSISRP
ncbi:MAG: ATP-grasp domain-containing protein [Synergistaceae bacterium]|nr:ATP-grasp domain-containing protein [Synergistaceae bacterium]